VPQQGTQAQLVLRAPAAGPPRRLALSAATSSQQHCPPTPSASLIRFAPWAPARVCVRGGG
jgi:hypothetical protein